MVLDELTIGEAKKLVQMFAQQTPSLNNGMIGKYVIVRCKDAGVHAGTLESYDGRACVLTNSRRLWYWKTNPNNGDFLDAIANAGVHSDSKIGPVTERKHLTENCEIIQCSPEATRSIQKAKLHEK